MLQLKVLDNKPVLAPGELEAYIGQSAPVLARACAGEAKYADSLGWLDVEEWAGEEMLARGEALAAEIRAKADVFVLIGVGGSNNAARAVAEAIQPAGGTRIVYAGNTLSPHAVNQMLAQLEGKEVYIDCIAKNFETLEPGVAFRVLRQYLVKRYGREEAARRILCTGTCGSSLEELCRREGYEFLPFATNVGGRYTALTYVHLVPLAVAGVDIRALAKGAADMARRLHTEPAEENLALRYAALRSLYFQKGYRVEILSAFEPQLRWFYKWWEQLFAESEGKDGTGLLPVTGEFSEQLHSLGQFIQDGTHLLFETFLDVQEQQASCVVQPDEVDDGFAYLDGKDFWQLNKASFQATRKAHSQTLPCLTLEMDRLDAYNFGQLFYFFEFACYLSGSLLGVNPFDQPGVEAYKGWMFQALGKPGANV